MYPRKIIFNVIINGRLFKSQIGELLSPNLCLEGPEFLIQNLVCYLRMTLHYSLESVVFLYIWNTAVSHAGILCAAERITRRRERQHTGQIYTWLARRSLSAKYSGMIWWWNRYYTLCVFNTIELDKRTNIEYLEYCDTRKDKNKTSKY